MYYFGRKQFLDCGFSSRTQKRIDVVIISNVDLREVLTREPRRSTTPKARELQF